MYRDLSKMSNVKSKAKKILKDINHLVEPAVPELSFKPDFMVNIENRLIFVEVVSLRHGENVDWRTLRLIEHIFEAKLFFGNTSGFNLIIPDKDEWKPYCIELLENFFDKVTYGPFLESARDLYTSPKTSNFRLWDLEREFERSRYRKFDDAYLRQFEYQDIPCIQLEEELRIKLSDLNLPAEAKYPVRNLKNYYLKRDMNLRFYFDFFVNNKIVEIKSFRKINSTALQNLLIKSRLIRYQKIGDEINQVPSYRMILFVNGDINGPEYDRLRYLRMLTHAGWDVYPISLLSTDKIRRVFRNGDKNF